jgi:flagellar protein FlbD
MILVTRLNGQPMALNADLIERAESNPDTVVTLVDGTKYVIRDGLEELVHAIREHRAEIMHLASRMDLRPTVEPDGARVLRLLPGTEA